VPHSRLSRAQRRAAIVLGEALRSDGFALAGGAALDAHGIGDRSTDDLDSFSSSCEDFGAAFDKAIASLREAGFDVKVDRRYESFCRLVVSSGRLRQRSFGVDLGVDFIMWGTEQTPLGPSLTVRELAANKVLAAFGRCETRDLCDLESLSSLLPARQMVADALSKDAGFDAEVLAEMTSRTLAKNLSEWPAGADLSKIRSFRDALVAAARKAESPAPPDGDGLDLASTDRPTGFVKPYRRKDGTLVRGYRRDGR